MELRNTFTNLRPGVLRSSSHLHIVDTTERAIADVICGQFSTVRLKFKLSTHIQETFLFSLFFFFSFFFLNNQPDALILRKVIPVVRVKLMYVESSQ